MVEDAAARDLRLAELEILRQSLDEKKDQLLRMAAEYDNYRKRMVKEREEIAFQSRAEVLRSVLQIYDAFQNACAALPGESGSGAVEDGLKLLAQAFEQLMSDQEISRIESEGRRYDPHLHEVVTSAPSEQEEGTILGEVQAGYKLGTHVLRHAKVCVSSGPAEKQEDKSHG